MTNMNQSTNKRTIESRCDPCFFGFHEVCFRTKDGRKRWGTAGTKGHGTTCNCPCMDRRETHAKR